MIVNFAERAHNHNWELDPVIRSLLDTDFYKLLMLQFIWKHYPDDPRVVLASQPHQRGPPRRHVLARGTHPPDGARAALAVSPVGTGLARRQHLLRPQRNFRARLPGMAGTRFPPIGLRESPSKTASIDLTFDGLWTETTMWELYALSILERTQDPSQHEKTARVRTRHPLCPRQNKTLEQDRAPPRRSRS